MKRNVYLSLKPLSEARKKVQDEGEAAILAVLTQEQKRAKKARMLPGTKIRLTGTPQSSESSATASLVRSSSSP